MQRPALVMSHNKTLARQHYGEFKRLFPHNAVTMFVSDYLVFPAANLPAANATNTTTSGRCSTRC